MGKLPAPYSAEAVAASRIVAGKQLLAKNWPVCKVKRGFPVLTG